jgi:aquaporin Z
MRTKALAAEFIGTFCLIMGVCGAALFSAPSAGLVSVSLAAGISVLAMAYAVGHLSGGHFNPAVTLGLVAAGRFEMSDTVGYIVAQTLADASRRRCLPSSCRERRRQGHSMISSKCRTPMAAHSSG